MNQAHATVFTLSIANPPGSLPRRVWSSLAAAGTVLIEPGEYQTQACRWQRELSNQGITCATTPRFAQDPAQWLTAYDVTDQATPLVILSLERDLAPLRAALGVPQEPAARTPSTEQSCGSDAHGERGEQVVDFIHVMDRIVGEGGCPWAVEQTHESLAPYALEEVHEVLEAIASGNRTDLREELGDLLMQVVFHARVAQKADDAPFTIDDVAAGISAKMRHRRPHLFDPHYQGDAAQSVEQTDDEWVRLKAQEKKRDSVLEGIPKTLPSLALAEKVLQRATKAGLRGAVLDNVDASDPGDELLELVARFQDVGVAPEEALRAAIGRAADRIRQEEAQRRGGGTQV